MTFQLFIIDEFFSKTLNNFVDSEINSNPTVPNQGPSYVGDVPSLSILFPTIFNEWSNMYEASHCHGMTRLLYDLTFLAVAP